MYSRDTATSGAAGSEEPLIGNAPVRTESCAWATDEEDSLLQTISWTTATTTTHIAALTHSRFAAWTASRAAIIHTG